MRTKEYLAKYAVAFFNISRSISARAKVCLSCLTCASNAGWLALEALAAINVPPFALVIHECNVCFDMPSWCDVAVMLCDLSSTNLTASILNSGV